MTAEQARKLKVGQWVHVQPFRSYDWSPSGCGPTNDDWVIVQQVEHGGLVVYCVDPFAHFCSTRVQWRYPADAIIEAGPMVNKP